MQVRATVGGMTEPALPDVARLLAPMLQDMPPPLLPFFLSRLERGAADRYRGWAERVSDDEVRAALLACAARETEIADRVEALFPVAGEDVTRVDAAVPAARDAYFAVFEGRSLEGEWRVQASAERQGAEAWRGLARQHPEHEQALLACAALEEASATCLEGLLGP